jgi:hypothetical protein
MGGAAVLRMTMHLNPQHQRNVYSACSASLGSTRAAHKAGRAYPSNAVRHVAPTAAPSIARRRSRCCPPRTQRFSSIKAMTLFSESRNSASQSSWSGMRAIMCGSPTKCTPLAASSPCRAAMSLTR